MNRLPWRRRKPIGGRSTEEVERIIAREVPVIPIHHHADVVMLDDDVRNWLVSNVEQNRYSRNLCKVAVEQFPGVPSMPRFAGPLLSLSVILGQLPTQLNLSWCSGGHQGLHFPVQVG